ncbi:MAG: signal peptidase I [Acetobacter sp.]|nr:signal peptidase I [Bacteroides sp.]MCM1340766.1 signal peptidase I [Acetobacter sp.]MCM1432677.1 signal peptidase I [Clostridiales bacterium]
MNTEQKEKKSGLQLTISVIGIILCIVFGFMLLSNLTIIVKGAIYPDSPPSVWGVTPLVVQSGSMSGTAADHIEVGDLVLIDKVDTQDLKEGDIIAFKDKNIIVTHRIKSIEKDENGKLLFTTKGDANNVEDANSVTADNVVGIYEQRIPKLGNFAMFLQQPLGMVLFIGVPVLVFIMYDIIRRQRYACTENEKAIQMQAEIDRLRKLNEEKRSDTYPAS